MKIHLRQIPEDGLHFEGEDQEDILQLPAEDHVKAVGPLRYSLDVGMSSDGLWVTGSLQLDVEMECVRCLETFVYPVEVDDVALQMERPAHETVDLTPDLREDILLALPAHPHCDWSGERVCPSRLPAPGEAEPPEGANGDTRPPSAWETLDRLKPPPQT